MSKFARRVWLAWTLGTAACHATVEDKQVVPTDAAPGDGGPYADFGKACTTDAECHGGVCFAFGDGSQVCTQPCTTAEQCPSGSQGQKCNKQGRCKP